jgi:hypothetical protein
MRFDAPLTPRRLTLYLFSLVGFSSLLIFGIVNLVAGNVVGGKGELVFAAVVFMNIMHLYAGGDVDHVGSAMLSLTLFLLAFLVMNGGVARTGLFWFFTFPLLTFYLKTPLKALLWNIGLWVVVVLIVVGGYSRFDFIILRQLFAGYCAVSLLVFFHDFAEKKLTLATEE